MPYLKLYDINKMKSVIGFLILMGYIANVLSTLALNTYICVINDSGISVIEVQLEDQTKTSYDITVNFEKTEDEYKTVVSAEVFSEIEHKLCLYAYVTNFALGEYLTTKEFSRLMSVGLNKEIEFYKTDEETKDYTELLRDVQSLQNVKAQPINLDPLIEFVETEHQTAQFKEEFEYDEDIIEL